VSGDHPQHQVDRRIALLHPRNPMDLEPIDGARRPG
jgi:hypothetical protein